MFRTVPLSIRSFSLYTQRNCPKHVEFYSMNKFEKLVNLVGFIIRSIWVIKSGRMRGVGHVTHNGGNGIMDACKVLLGKLTRQRQL